MLPTVHPLTTEEVQAHLIHLRDALHRAKPGQTVSPLSPAQIGIPDAALADAAHAARVRLEDWKHAHACAHEGGDRDRAVFSENVVRDIAWRAAALKQEQERRAALPGHARLTESHLRAEIAMLAPTLVSSFNTVPEPDIMP